MTSATTAQLERIRGKAALMQNRIRGLDRQLDEQLPLLGTEMRAGGLWEFSRLDVTIFALVFTLASLFAFGSGFIAGYKH